MSVALDTNVVSELLKPNCDERVMRWAQGFPSEAFLLPAPCLAELRRGVGLLPDGRRRRVLSEILDEFVDAVGGVLPFDRAAAEIYGELATQPGRPRPTTDAMIAAICRADDVLLATRNVKDFQQCGVRLVDPWL